MATIPTGNYPKMVTASNGVNIVPLVYPPGDAKQFMYVILNNATEEAAYAGNGVLISSIAPASSSHGNAYQTGQWSNKGRQ
jgi:hypothetical protein